MEFAVRDLCGTWTLGEPGTYPFAVSFGFRTCRFGVLEKELPVAEKGTIWFCELCGQKVKVLEEGGGVLVCCGQDMVEVEE